MIKILDMIKNPLIYQILAQIIAFIGKTNPCLIVILYTNGIFFFIFLVKRNMHSQLCYSLYFKDFLYFYLINSQGTISFHLLTKV